MLAPLTVSIESDNQVPLKGRLLKIVLMLMMIGYVVMFWCLAVQARYEQQKVKVAYELQTLNTQLYHTLVALSEGQAENYAQVNALTDNMQERLIKTQRINKSIFVKESNDMKSLVLALEQSWFSIKNHVDHLNKNKRKFDELASIQEQVSAYFEASIGILKEIKGQPGLEALAEQRKLSQDIEYEYKKSGKPLNFRPQTTEKLSNLYHHNITIKPKLMGKLDENGQYQYKKYCEEMDKLHSAVAHGKAVLIELNGGEGDYSGIFSKNGNAIKNVLNGYFLPNEKGLIDFQAGAILSLLVLLVYLYSNRLDYANIRTLHEHHAFVETRLNAELNKLFQDLEKTCSEKYKKLDPADYMVTKRIAERNNVLIEKFRVELGSILQLFKKYATIVDKNNSSLQSAATEYKSFQKTVDFIKKDVGTATQSVQEMVQKTQVAFKYIQTATEIIHSGDTLLKDIEQGQTSKSLIGEVHATTTNAGKKSKEIYDHIKAISNVAKQTNVLALNASIRAADFSGQGEQSGFAHVAEEIVTHAERIDQMLVRGDTMLEALSSELDAIAATVKSAEHTLNQDDTLVTIARTQIQNVSNTSAELQKITSELNEQIGRYIGRFAILDKDIGGLLTAVSETENKASALFGRIKALDPMVAQIDTLAKKLDLDINA